MAFAYLRAEIVSLAHDRFEQFTLDRLTKDAAVAYISNMTISSAFWHSIAKCFNEN